MSMDPNTVPGMGVVPISNEWRIYGSDDLEIYALVDQEDYQWACQWRWSPKWSKGGRKFYLRRNLQIGPRAFRVQKCLFLHEAIMNRHGHFKMDNTPICDHKNGDSLDCRKANLRYVTHAENARNRRGSAHHFKLQIIRELA